MQKCLNFQLPIWNAHASHCVMLQYFENWETFPISLWFLEYSSKLGVCVFWNWKYGYFLTISCSWNMKVRYFIFWHQPTHSITNLFVTFHYLILNNLGRGGIFFSRGDINSGLCLDIYRTISYKLGLMIGVTNLICLYQCEQPWPSIKVTIIWESENFCTHFVTNFYLDEIWYITMTYWSVQVHHKFVFLVFCVCGFFSLFSFLLSLCMISIQRREPFLGEHWLVFRCLYKPVSFKHGMIIDMIKKYIFGSSFKSPDLHRVIWNLPSFCCVVTSSRLTFEGVDYVRGWLQRNLAIMAHRLSICSLFFHLLKKKKSLSFFCGSYFCSFF